MATRLVEQWLKIARGEISSQNSNVFNKENLLDPQSQINVKPVQMFSEHSLDNAGDLNTVDSNLCVSQINENDVTDCANELGEMEESEGLVFKITMKDGKQTLAKISETSPKKNGNRKDSDSDERTSVKKSKDDKRSDENRSKDEKERDKVKDHHDKHKKSSSSSSSSSHRGSSSGKSSSSSSKHNSSSSSSKSSSSHSKSHKSSSSSSSSHKSSSSSSRDKDRHKSSSKSSTSSSKDKSKSESSKTQAEKDKDTLAKIQPKSLEKVGKIPKKSNSDELAKKTTDDSGKKSSENETAVSAKKKSISIEVRKDTENRPKTVKTYNSQFRSHGLGEEAPPPPSRRDLKKTTATVPTNGIPIVPKRSLSPTNNTAKELEKRMKLSSPTVEKPGAIKLIPAKPKRKYFIDLDLTNGSCIVFSQVVS